MKNEIIAIGLLAALAASAGIVIASGHGHAHENFGPERAWEPFNASHEFPMARERLMNQTNMTGCPFFHGNEMNDDMRNATMKKMEDEKNAWALRAKNKLGLPSNATDDEFNEALSRWGEENKDLLQAFRMMTSGRR